MRLAAECGAGNVRVFGSVARGDTDSRSDVDLLVDLEPGRICWIWRGCSASSKNC